MSAVDVLEDSLAPLKVVAFYKGRKTSFAAVGQNTGALRLLRTKGEAGILPAGPAYVILAHDKVGDECRTY